jgi:hypothetical protein
MRRLRSAIPLALLVLCLGLPGVSSANHSNGQGPPKDMVTGTGQIFDGTNQVHVNAIGGPAGEDAKGQLTQHAPGFFRLKGSVICLNLQAPNVAVVGIQVEEFDPEEMFVGPEPLFAIYRFEDNGEPGEGVDWLSGALLQQPRNDCTRQSRGNPILQGNYVVHDG